MQSDFAGKNNFVWFTGVVENRQEDPLKMGRVKVRIIGFHSENKEECPTEDLPWAQVLYSTNLPRAFSTPREKEWVFGFFLDGESGQMPVIVGVYGTGAVSKATMDLLVQQGTSTAPKSATGTSTASTTKSATVEPYSDENESTDAFTGLPYKPGLIPKVPKPPAGIIEETLGLPNIVKVTRGVIDNTAIAFTNNVRSFFCSSEGEVAKALAFVKSGIRMAAVAVREGFKALLRALGFSASAGGMLETIKSITKYIKDLNDLINNITKWIKEIKEAIQKILDYIKMLKDLIQILKNLPKQLLEQIVNCLKRALKSLKRSLLQELKNEIESSIPEEITEFLEALEGTLANSRAFITEINGVSNLVNGVPIIKDPGSEFFSLSTILSTSKNSSTTILANNNSVLSEPNTQLAITYIFDGTGNTDVSNVNSEILTLDKMEPREREQLVYNLFPGSERFSFSSVKLA